MINVYIQITYWIWRKQGKDRSEDGRNLKTLGGIEKKENLTVNPRNTKSIGPISPFGPPRKKTSNSYDLKENSATGLTRGCKRRKEKW